MTKIALLWRLDTFPFGSVVLRKSRFCRYCSSDTLSPFLWFCPFCRGCVRFLFFNVVDGLKSALFGSLVITQPFKDWLAHQAGRGPFSELHLADQSWLDPFDGLIRRGWMSEG